MEKHGVDTLPIYHSPEYHSFAGEQELDLNNFHSGFRRWLVLSFREAADG
jgi:hypothetical protein